LDRCRPPAAHDSRVLHPDEDALGEGGVMTIADDTVKVAEAQRLENELIIEARRLYGEVGLKDTAIASRLKQTRHWVRKHVGWGFFEPAAATIRNQNYNNRRGSCANLGNGLVMLIRHGGVA
jgi:hypothetical protein